MSSYEAEETQILMDLYESDSKSGIKENRPGTSTSPKLSARLDEFTKEAYDDLIDISDISDDKELQSSIVYNNKLIFNYCVSCGKENINKSIECTSCSTNLSRSFYE